MTAIDDKYAALGGATGVLGKAVGQEMVASDQVGRYRHYQNGSLYWHPKTQAHLLSGAIRDRWTKLGAERSTLGYPVSDESATTLPQAGGRFNHFQNGSIYWRKDSGAHAVVGEIRGRWLALGAEQSALGFPTSDEAPTADAKGRQQSFQGGRIDWRPETGARWAGAGGPTTDPFGVGESLPSILSRLGKLADVAIPEPQDPAALAAILEKLALDWRAPHDEPKPDPLFDKAMSGRRGVPSVEERVKLVEAKLGELQKEKPRGGRAQRFYPYLLIRSAVGDNGTRPLDPGRIPPTVSPDIWVRRGFPDPNPLDASTPRPDDPGLLVGGVPVTQLRSIPGTDLSVAPSAHGFHEALHAGTAYTIYAQVWNLGRAPIAGVRVEFHYADSWLDWRPTTQSRPLGVCRVDLAPRTSTYCHQFVRCPVPFVPARSGASKPGTEESQTLIVRVSCVGDAVEDAWSPLADRHVAFRAFSVI